MQANSAEPACSPWTGPQCLTVAISNDTSGIDDAVGQSCIKSFQSDNKLKHSNVNTTLVCFVYEHYVLLWEPESDLKGHSALLVVPLWSGSSMFFVFQITSLR